MVIGRRGGKGEGVLFKKGEIVKKVKESEILVELKKMIMEDEKNEEDKGILGN